VEITIKEAERRFGNILGVNMKITLNVTDATDVRVVAGVWVTDAAAERGGSAPLTQKQTQNSWKRNK
jgi:hypothetical protein